MSESPSETVPNLLAELHLAACFLTRLPLPDAGPVAPGGLAAAMRCFPVVGAVVGLAAAAVHALASLWLPTLPAALLAVTALVLLTGALHEDGLADFADGLGARGDRARRLEVMRDSRTGSFGVLALVFSVALRGAALAALPSGWIATGALVAAAALSRALMPAAMQAMAPARADGLGASCGVPHAGVAATAVVVALLLSLPGLGLGGTLAAALAGGLAALGVTWLARRAIGGYTGDVLGAIQQVSEAAVLLAAVGTI
ncbi:MAG: adenosylcobinamide-GDP ribazoletransferase [Magnetospirillum sp.]|nr:adenosylcobinamide-GDP ribazoletransferase [Magnetospirillum sp.]